MRRIFLLLFSAAVALLLASGAVVALPSEKPDQSPMIDGRVRAIEQVGTNIWIGGRFSRVEQRNGTHSFQGVLDPNWHPAYAGSYSLVWELHVEGARLHTGGEFKTVSGVTQNSYARLSPDSIKGTIKGNNRANTLVGTPDSEAIYGYGGADRVDARGGPDTLRLGGGKDKGRGGRGDDRIRAVDGSKDDVSCGPGADRVRANPGDNVTGECEKVKRAGKRVG